MSGHRGIPDTVRAMPFRPALSRLRTAPKVAARWASIAIASSTKEK